MKTGGASGAGLLRLKIQMLLAKGCVEDAISLTEICRGQHPDDFDVSAALADLYNRTGRLDLSDALSATLTPTSAQEKEKLLRVRGDCALARYDLESAEALFQDLGGLNVTFSGNIKNMIRALKVALMKGDLLKARAHADRVDESCKGQAPDRIRSFYVLLLEEFFKFPELIERLNHIQKASLPEQYEHLLGLTSGAECGCPGSMVLLTAARRLKVFEREARLARSERQVVIPPSIVQFWDTEMVPEDVKGAMESWRRNCIACRYQLFNDDSAEDFIRAYCSQDVMLAFRSARHAAMRSDLFRLAYLYQFGGVYADADDSCRRDITPLIESGDSLVLLQEDVGSIGNNFMAAVPKHPWVKYALEQLVTRVLTRADGNIWFATGPGALSSCFCRYYLEDLRQRRLPAGVCVRDVHRLLSYISVHLPLRYKETTHWVSLAHRRTRRPQVC